MREYDYSTIDMDRLRKLPIAKLAPTYRLQNGVPGNGCCGDPPGYPTYFTRSVYTCFGNNPRRGAEMVLLGHVVQDASWLPGEDWDKRHARFLKLLHSLWVPLPLEHERTREWIKHQYQYLAHCYQDVERPEYNRSGMLVYPVPDYKLKRPTIDPHWTEEYKGAVQAEAEVFNRQEIERAQRIATVDNHLAVVTIRRFYPDYLKGWEYTLSCQADVNLIHNPPQLRQADWWEREAERPSETDCPGHLGTKHGTHDHCGYCGRTGLKLEEVTT